MSLFCIFIENISLCVINLLLFRVNFLIYYLKKKYFSYLCHPVNNFLGLLLSKI